MLKDCEVIMQSSKEADDKIIFEYGDGKLSYHKGPFTKDYLRFIGVVPQHLYIVSNDDIKKDDWVFDPIGHRVTKIAQNIKSGQFGAKKIIATTDKTMQLVQDKSMSVSELVIANKVWVSNIPESFVKVFVEANGIYEIQVEYEYAELDVKYSTSRTIPKLRDDNTIIIHQAKTYNKEDVFKAQIEFATWYSGMGREKVLKAYERWLREK